MFAPSIATPASPLFGSPASPDSPYNDPLGGFDLPKLSLPEPLAPSGLFGFPSFLLPPIPAESPSNTTPNVGMPSGETPDSKGKVPFKGGQRVGKTYEVKITFRKFDFGSVSRQATLTAYAKGPVGGANFVVYEEFGNYRGFSGRLQDGSRQGYVQFEATSGSISGATYFVIDEVKVSPPDDSATDGDPSPVGANPNQRKSTPRVLSPDGTYSPSRTPALSPTSPSVSGIDAGSIAGLPNGNVGDKPRAIPSAPSTTGGNEGTGNNTGTGTGTSTGAGGITGAGSTPASQSGSGVKTGADGLIIGGGVDPAKISDTLTLDPTIVKDRDKAKDVAPPIPQTGTQNPDLGAIKGLLDALPLAVAGTLAVNQLFRESVTSATKTGVCQSAQPNECLGQAISGAVNPLSGKLDALDAANTGANIANAAANSANASANAANAAANSANATANAANTSLLGAIQTFLTAFQALVVKAFNNTIVDKAIAALTLVTTIHNAAMLSTSIKDTLAEAISQGLATIGIKAPDDSPIDVNAAINSSIEGLLKSILGADQYQGLKEAWAKANRTVQSGAAILYNVRSLYDSARSLNELTGNNVGRIGNALKRDGVVSENAYKPMSENVTSVNAAMDKLQNLENTVSTLASITSETYSITQNVQELTKQRADFEKNLKDLPTKEQVENLAVKSKENAGKLVSQAPVIPLTELYKPDI